MGPPLQENCRLIATWYKSTRMELAGLDHAWVHGDLTMRGVTRPVTLDVH
ncbi:MAG: YceI family protein [Deltaproteobacteria bacterium]|nr:YceI family protein [Deltaproteobacteria bacterium]